MTDSTSKAAHVHLSEERQSQTKTVSPPTILRDAAHLAGVSFNGDQPWDIQVFDSRVYRRILTHGSLGFGESYMDNMWECHELDELFHRLLKVDIEKHLGSVAKFRLYFEIIRQNLFNRQTSKRAYEVGKKHYDTGNDIFQAMLDPTMSYSCGYWANADTLAQAQIGKLDLICRKLMLQPGERVLEIGCGWGSFAQYAAQNYGVEVYGITISKEQQILAQERCAGLPVTIELMDYRDLEGQFDKIVSIGMFEHVGPKNYPVYFDSAMKLLKPEGLFLLHTIGIHATSLKVDPWIDKYIFRNGKLPSAEELASVINGRFVIEDWHNFGTDYDKTLMAWWENFDKAWPELSTHYDERFYRMWKYYLHSCAGFFRSKQGQLWQLVLSKHGRDGEYRSLR
ncbi:MULTISPECIES: cyclopropane fatty acyl phospholipid synthase [unclassified Methylophaga]|uniref:cyclopropane fatty acyl phospholipid synthase n=1 Tax=unclassified Methylophaga TaxID=2629249 RepID=UPI000C98570F|nr:MULTISPECIES: cyclopropane fatty acyl phospholipid synthase [unclassified Methylophaga]MBN45716.1 cyclopropane-fatty-acyl-phospholipid synthase [Methylophaga sp.]|tara:strand:+ start:39232 stop:40419 length:1188 start_codon:yes stop_codon:yes gene_type:complete